MTKLHKFLCLFSLCLLPSCDYIFPSTWNYRITVEIETPEGIKSGSAVRQVRAWQNLTQFINPDARSSSHKIIGEAVAVDLGERGVLFALIDSRSYEEVYEALPSNKDTWPETFRYYRSIKSGTKAELKKRKPKMVTFTDLSDPKSVKAVYYGRMDEALGEGVHLKSITVEMTDDPVTWELEDRLSYYKTKEFQNWYNGLPYGDLRRVHIYHLQRRK